jgi:rare lipoprotein A
MNKKNKALLLLAVLVLSACSTGRYKDANDSIPSRLPNQAELKDAIPRPELPSRGGNKNYKVRGINYSVLNSAQGFEQTGTASWYGNKFHGHLTSNGEIYDMYAMSAAHKNLPLPSYAKVTNLANSKSVIVRVNDRGPFHESRIIDLSYSAAYKLDMLQKGTANVKITAITEFPNKTKKYRSQTTKVNDNISSSLAQEKNYIQVFATSKLKVAKETAETLSKRYSQTVNYPKENGIYRIQMGPVVNKEKLIKLLGDLKQGLYPNAYLRSL